MVARLHACLTAATPVGLGLAGSVTLHWGQCKKAAGCPDASAIADSVAMPQPAHRFQLLWARRLKRRNWRVSWEVPVQVQKDRRGFIDLVVTNDRWTVAVELDNVAPREKSIRKLALFQCDRAYVVCRSGIILRVQ